MQEWFNDIGKLKSVIGTKVVITSCATKRYQSYELVNKRGVITNYRVTTGRQYLVKSYAVEIIGTRNPNSDTGVFWFSPDELKIENNIERNNTMKTYTVKLRHPSNGGITYAIALEEFVEGDTVVADYHCGNGALSVRYVEAVAEYKSAHNLLLKDGVEVIGKVDRSHYDTMIDRRKKQVELEDKLRRHAMECKEEYLWRVMAEYDPEMRRLLDELEEFKK